MAEIGKAIFYDKSLSGSGKLSCASCHDPHNHYGPSGASSVFLGGSALSDEGKRTIPSLTYLERQPAFSIGPDDPASEGENAPVLPASTAAAAHGAKSATNTQSSATNLVPQGGLFWDGRADTLQQQARGPLYDPAEMASTPHKVLATLENAPYGEPLKQFAGPAGERSPAFLLDEAMFALARYQIEESSFHPYSSKFDDWLEGKDHFTAAEVRGYRLFNDPAKGNCAACHVDTVGRNRLPPLFTDHQYEALGIPRNKALKKTHDASYYDVGVCDQPADGRFPVGDYCGMFTTPTLRNAATRKVFFHNGVFHSLDDVMDFYVLRDLQPGRFYSRDSHGKVVLYDDIPKKYRKNVDVSDAPFDRKPGDKPALTEDERQAIIAFLKTLTDRKSD
ncbi:cytochrome-c peroxidase [Acetobacter sp. LMG 1627]|uniref:Cytochrome-c peroxidase n=2 Tax=Acetobacter conturbans TaxID=1737472 RepID=A0ABX0JW13_9PROT|nr:cytochrome c peroxidase [Acetobacter conturbans]NHN87416.1 cytochrome-c peroxidase [Acetobacter conturbans]